MKSSNRTRLEYLLRLARDKQLAQSLILSGDIKTLDDVQDRLVRSLLCEQQGGEDCRCRSCATRFEDHPDYLRLAPSPRTISRDSVQEAMAGLIAGPLWSPNKVIVIRPSDKLGREAESYLLKHLEEPPAFVYYLLVTTTPDAMIATIRSRSQHWRFVLETDLDSHAVEDLSQQIRQQGASLDDVVQLAFYAKNQYLATGQGAWLSLWETLQEAYRQLESNGNAELVATTILRRWPR